MQFFQKGIREARADVADCFKRLSAAVVGSEKEGAVYGCAFTATVVRT